MFPADENKNPNHVVYDDKTETMHVYNFTLLVCPDTPTKLFRMWVGDDNN